MSDSTTNFTRIGSAVGISPAHVAPYLDLHKNVWPDVQEALTAAHMSNYTIFYLKEKDALFSYHEYSGTDRDADRRILNENLRVQEWLKLCREYQTPLSSQPGTGRVWTDLPIFFHKP